MQDALIDDWAREPQMSEHLKSLRGLNRRFLDLGGAGAGDWPQGRRGLTAELAGQLAPLSREQRSAAANCPYALFDLRFEDEGHWKGRLQNAGTWRVGDELKADDDTGNFVQLALFYAWHVASRAGLAARLLLGMHHGTADAFRGITVDSLPALAAAEAANLAPRWWECGAYWSALVSAAARSDSTALRRVQLYGLQLTVAARLPNS
jgi:hypothetical protein